MEKLDPTYCMRSPISQKSVLLKDSLTININATRYHRIETSTGSAFRPWEPSRTSFHRSPSRSQNVVVEATSGIVQLYQSCNSEYRPSLQKPKRCLTKPDQPAKNGGYDNIENDYILHVDDVIGDKEGQKFIILDTLGSGTFGQVVKCLNAKTKELVAVKVIKNKPAYFNQSMMEVTILELLNAREFPAPTIVKMLDTFIFRKHLCLVFEVLSVNLYELIRQNKFAGLSMNLVRIFTKQILEALVVLNEAKIVHCDLKPENILLKSLENPSIKVIDFGSACHEQQTVYTYIQSRFYRSPEVLLGLPYSSSIDMWSLGCISAELFLGLPIFPGSSEFNQITRIVESLGNPPVYMLEFGKNSRNFFNRVLLPSGKPLWNIKPLQQFNAENNADEKPSKRYFQSTTIPSLIYNYRKKQDTEGDPHRTCFIDFLTGVLNLNPLERWSASLAKQHPFITGDAFVCPFVAPTRSRLIQRPKYPMTAPSSVPGSPFTNQNPNVSNRSRQRANTIHSQLAVPPSLQRLGHTSNQSSANSLPRNRVDTQSNDQTVPSIEQLSLQSFPSIRSGSMGSINSQPASQTPLRMAKSQSSHWNITPNQMNLSTSSLKKQSTGRELPEPQTLSQNVNVSLERIKEVDETQPALFHRRMSAPVIRVGQGSTVNEQKSQFLTSLYHQGQQISPNADTSLIRSQAQLQRELPPLYSSQELVRPLFGSVEQPFAMVPPVALVGPPRDPKKENGPRQEAKIN